MRVQRLQQYFLIFIGDCIPNLHGKTGKAISPVVDLQVLISLSKSMPPRNKIQAHGKKTVFKMRGNCQVCVVYYCACILHFIASK